jgi:betaine-homocysteine S-methyltransferase
MRRGLLERLSDGVVLGDGGYLLELERRGYVQAGPFTPEVSIVHPEALAELHREFLLAGAEVLQALTFYASEEKLATVGLAGRVDDINRAAVEVARGVAADQDVLVAGNLSLTWAYDPSDLGSSDRVRALFDRQLEVQMDVGIDVVVCETFTWLQEALIATERAKATGLPVVTTMAFERAPTSYEGDSPGECARRLVDAGADVVGVNCLRPPKRMLGLAAEMLASVSAPVACQPAAYRTPHDQPDFTALPAFPYELDPLQLSRLEMAEYAVEAKQLGVGYIGSCCGSIAAHVRAMARALGKRPSEERPWRIDYDKPMSAYEYYQHTEREAAP